MFKTVDVWISVIWILIIWICFEFRYSNFGFINSCKSKDCFIISVKAFKGFNALDSRFRGNDRKNIRITGINNRDLCDCLFELGEYFAACGNLVAVGTLPVGIRIALEHPINLAAGENHRCVIFVAHQSANLRVRHLSIFSGKVHAERTS